MKNISYYNSKNYRILPKPYTNIKKNLTDADDSENEGNTSYIVKDIRNLISNEKLKKDESLQFSLCFYNLDENEKTNKDNNKETSLIENSKGDAIEEDGFVSQVSQFKKTPTTVFYLFFFVFI